jgi:pilus assembly protein CpaC
MTKKGATAGIVLLAAFATLLVPVYSPVFAPAYAQDDEGTPAAAAAAAKNKYKKSKLTNDESETVADHRKLLLTTGEDKAVDLDFDTALESKFISVGNPALVLPQLVKIGDKKQIVFKPLKSGETTVTVRDGDGNLRVIFLVRITGSSLLRVAGEVRSLLRDIEGLDIRIVGPKVVIEGEVLVPSDYARLLMVASDKSYADFILNMSTMSPIALQILSKRIQEDINTFAPNVKTRVVNGRIFLEGTVDNDFQAQRAVRVAGLYLPEVKPGNPLEKVDPTAQRFALPGGGPIVSFIVVNPPAPKKQDKLIRLTVHFVELSKDYSKVFGFKWEPGFTADPTITVGQSATSTGTPGSSPVSFTATISSLIPKLLSAQDAGYARVLKTATIIVRSGKNASLNDGLSVPFVTQGQNGQPQGASKDVGLDVAVTPQILGQSEDIEMELKMSQTNLVGRAPSGTAPLLSTHKIDTKLYIKNGESAAVAGVNSSDVGTDFNKDDPSPGSFQGGTDPLFTLLHSKAYRKKKSQFVIFVTPQIVENASDGTEDLKRNFRVKVR